HSAQQLSPAVRNACEDLINGTKPAAVTQNTRRLVKRRDGKRLFVKRVQPFADDLLAIVGARHKLRTIAIAYEIALGRSRFQVVDRAALWTRPPQRDPFYDNVIRDQQLHNAEGPRA